MSSFFETTTNIKFHQTDPAGIMFFGHIFTLAHDAYEQFVLQLGYNWNEWFQNNQFALPVKHTSSNFFKPLIGGELYQVQISVTEIGENHFKLTIAFTKKGALHAQVDFVQVGYSPQKNQKMALPNSLVEKLKIYSKEISHD